MPITRRPGVKKNVQNTGLFGNLSAALRLASKGARIYTSAQRQSVRTTRVTKPVKRQSPVSPTRKSLPAARPPVKTPVRKTDGKKRK